MNSFELQLDPTNHWVGLAKIIPWDKMVAIYDKKFNKSKTVGAPGINA